MSSKSGRHPAKKESGATATDLEEEEKARDEGYSVGYGKPPKHTRFVKGQSGNPRGRPRKPKPQPPRLSDALLDGFFEKEAYRSVALRENGQPIELPAAQAVLRALTTDAIKGERLSQKYFLESLARMEELHFRRKVDDYVRLQTAKREGEEALAKHKRKGLPPPDLLPHPEDIVLNAATGEAYVNGPETPEDVCLYEHTVRLRDHLLLRSANRPYFHKKTPAESEDDQGCPYMVLAHLFDHFLPPRYRWQDDAEVDLMREYIGLPKRQRERRIAEEAVDLVATTPKYTRITPKMEWEIDRMVRKFRQDAQGL